MKNRKWKKQKIKEKKKRIQIRCRNMFIMYSNMVTSSNGNANTNQRYDPFRLHRESRQRQVFYFGCRRTYTHTHTHYHWKIWYDNVIFRDNGFWIFFSLSLSFRLMLCRLVGIHNAFSIFLFSDTLISFSFLVLCYHFSVKPFWIFRFKGEPVSTWVWA